MSEADLAIRQARSAEWKLGPIFDADAHIEPPFEMWKDYLPASLRDRAPYLEEGDEFDFVVFEGNRRPLNQLNNTAGIDGKKYKKNVKRTEMRPVWLPEVRLGDMDADGMDQALLFGGGPLGTFDDELYIASYEAYSSWVMDWCSVAPDRLYPVGYVPMRDIDETITHVKRLAKMGFRAINIPAFPQNKEAWKTSSGVKALNSGQVSAQTGDPKGSLQYSNRDFDKLWSVLCDEGLAITFHLGARVPRFGEKEFFLADMPMSKMGMAEPLGILIFNCIFDRFPELRVGSMESGVGWFAWFSEYITRTWERQRYWTESELKNPPSYYMETNIWGSFIQDRAGFYCHKLPGAKNVMWSSDYPHSETTFPNSHEIILRDSAGVPEDAIRDIICNNAKRLLRLA